MFEQASKNNLKNIIKCDFGFMGHNKVSIDYISATESAIILMNKIQLTKSRYLTLSVFHDNEWGYSNRVCDLIKHLEKTLVN